MMAQLEPHLTLTLRHLGGSGVVLPEELQRAIERSIPIKRVESGLASIVLWGRITTLNGKDYLIASGSNGGTVRQRLVDGRAQFFVSQDGIKWATLPPIEPATAAMCAALCTLLSGDPQASHALPRPSPATTAAGEGRAPPARPAELGELTRLRAIVDDIDAATSVVPLGALVADGAGRVVRNPLFTGSAHPAKLEGFAHAATALDVTQGSLAQQDVRGSWALQSDTFEGVTVLRSLLYPGYVFYYHARNLTWGGLYQGPGLRNNDLAFML